MTRARAEYVLLKLRHDVSYHAGVISEQEAESTRRDAAEIVAIVRPML